MKNNRRRYHKKSVTVMCVIVLVALIVTGVAGISAFMEPLDIQVNSSTTEKERVLTEARKVLASNSNYMLYIEGYQSETGEEPLYFSYQIAGSKDDSAKSYTYQSTSGYADTEYWFYDRESESYIDFVYSADIDGWVQCTLDFEPVELYPFDVLEDMEDFELLAERQKFGENEEECYCFQLVGTTEEYEVCYERIYVGVDDYLLKGAIRMAVHDLDGTVVDTMDEATLEQLYDAKGIEQGDNGEMEITSETSSTDELLFRFEYYFSNLDMKFIEQPSVFITADEYAEWKGIELEEKEDGEEE